MTFKEEPMVSGLFLIFHPICSFPFSLSLSLISSSPTPPSFIPPHPLHFSSEKGKSAVDCQVTVRLGASPASARQCNPVGERARQQNPKQLLLPVWILTERPSYTAVRCSGPRSVPAGSLVGSLVSWASLSPGSLILQGFLRHPWSLWLLQPLFCGIPQALPSVWLWFCICSHQLGWSLLMTPGLHTSLRAQQSIISSCFIDFLFFPFVSDSVLGRSLLPLAPRPLGSAKGGLPPLAWVSRSPRHWLANPTILHNLTPAHLIDRTKSRWMVLWLTWWPSLATGSLAFQEMADSGSKYLTSKAKFYWGKIDMQSAPTLSVLLDKFW